MQDYRQFCLKCCVPGILALALLLGVPGAAAQDERVLYEGPVDGCTLAVTADDRWQGIRLRRRPAGTDCRLDEVSVGEALARAFAAAADGPRATSLFLGRVEYLDWMSRHLVERALGDAGWAAGAGAGAHNAFVARVLNEPEATAPLADAIAAGGYRIDGVSCEKVLVSGPATARLHPPWVPRGARVPYDALCWLRLAPAR